MTTKVCTKCSQDLQLSEYYKHLTGKDGLHASCKVCYREASSKRYHANPEQGKEKARKWRQANPEKVKANKQKWAAANPEKGREARQRYYAKNSGTIKERDKRYRQKNPEKIKATNQRYTAANPGKSTARNQKWVAANPERAKALVKQWAAANPGRRAASAAKRRAAKRQAMPGWLSESQINEITQIYIDCPKGFHVDHLVPIQGATVSGLHVPWNLKSIPASENLRKGNKLIEVQ